jgi:acetyltransferase-like isoleucine patch superfamily enzyme
MPPWTMRVLARSRSRDAGSTLMSQQALRDWLSGYPSTTSPMMAQTMDDLLSTLPDDAVAGFDPADPVHVKRLADLGITVPPVKGRDNLIVLDRRSRIDGKLTVNFPVTHGIAATGNTLVLGSGIALSGEITFRGLNNLCVIAGGVTGAGVVFNLIQNRTTLGIGANCVMSDVNCGVQGEGRIMSIGAGCRFEGGNWFRTSDGHSIIDIETRAVINPSADLTIGRNAAFGRDTLVMKGSVLGDGVTVAEGSLVSGAIPSGATVSGVPARVLQQTAQKRDTRWSSWVSRRRPT